MQCDNVDPAMQPGNLRCARGVASTRPRTAGVRKFLSAASSGRGLGTEHCALPSLATVASRHPDVNAPTREPMLMLLRALHEDPHTGVESRVPCHGAPRLPLRARPVAMSRSIRRVFSRTDGPDGSVR